MATLGRSDVGSSPEDNPQNTLQGQAHAQEQWRKWLTAPERQGDTAAAPLEKQCQELMEIWKKLKNLYPQLGPLDELPTISSLQLQVEKAEQDWIGKHGHGWGKARNLFSAFIGTMNNHAYLFSVIPDGDKYTSVLTGVVKSVVQVSSNHRKIVEGFSLALVEISDDLRFVRRSSRVSQSSEMKILVIHLYVDVFKFLCHAVEFFTSRKNRIKASLNQNFYDDKVQRMVSAIQRTVSLVSRESELAT